MTNLKYMKLYIGKHELAEKLGIDTQEFFISNIKIDNSQDIEFLVTLSGDAEINDTFEASNVVDGVSYLRRQGFK